MRISVVIPAFNEEKLLGETLVHVKSAMAAFTRRNWETELIVCDNNSGDRTGEIARAGGATVVFEPVNSISGARNRGAEAATGDWLVIMDADTQPTVELFDDVAGHIESGQCIAGGCTMRMETNHLVALAVAKFWNRLSRWRKVFGGWLIFCEASTFRTIQGFNLKLMASEDIDISMRLRKLARSLGKKTVVLSRYPMLISARKVKLYGVWKHLWFIITVVFTGGRVLTSRTACFLWYGGKR